MNTRFRLAPALYLLFFGTCCMISCSKDAEEPGVLLPSNLSVTVTVDEGDVTLSATADNANFYSFVFSEGEESTTLQEVNGEGEYTYASSGTYEILIRAHATNAAFIEKAETVVIAIDPGWTGGIPTTGYSTPMSYPGLTLVWNDEFEGNALSSDWIHEIGTGNWGWGNNELQFYRSENTEVSDGLLKITAKEEWFNGSNYTSSRIKTQGLQSFEKGRIDIRAALPYGQGIWPALWMLGESHSTVGWPDCGEIDIMEMVGGAGNNNATVHGTIHWDNAGSWANYGGSTTLSEGIFAEEFHVFSILWDDNAIRWYLDEVQYHVVDITPANLSEFHEEFFFIFNVAVGGQWPGSPNETTVFPQTMAVDYVRVFQ